MDAMIIGLDHGYAAIKGPHCTFPTGLVAYDYPPYTQKNGWCHNIVDISKSIPK